MKDSDYLHIKSLQKLILHSGLITIPVYLHCWAVSLAESAERPAEWTAGPWRSSVPRTQRGRPAGRWGTGAASRAVASRGRTARGVPMHRRIERSPGTVPATWDLRPPPPLKGAEQRTTPAPCCGSPQDEAVVNRCYLYTRSPLLARTFVQVEKGVVQRQGSVHYREFVVDIETHVRCSLALPRFPVRFLINGPRSAVTRWVVSSCIQRSWTLNVSLCVNAHLRKNSRSYDITIKLFCTGFTFTLPTLSVVGSPLHLYQSMLDYMLGLHDFVTR